MGRAPCCDKDGLKKGPWTPEEDQKLIDYIQKNGCGNWRTLPKKAGLQRCGKSCRLRWTNYLRPDIKRGKFSLEEEETIIQLHRILGNKWSAIASRLPGRTDNEIKNYWNTNIRKKLLRMGIDPITHSPRLDLLDLSTILNPSIYSNNNISRLLGMQNLVINPDLIKLLLPNYQRNHYNQDSLQIQNPQTLISSDDNQMLNDDGNRIQTQNPVQDLSTTCHGDDQLLQNGFDCDQWQHGSNGPMISANAHEDYVPVITDSGPYYGLDRAFADQNLSSESSNFQSNLSFQSVLPNMSSPSSINATPLSSNSIFGEDERESYCSSSNMLLKYDMQDIWDVNDFM